MRLKITNQSMVEWNYTETNKDPLIIEYDEPISELFSEYELPFIDRGGIEILQGNIKETANR